MAVLRVVSFPESRRGWDGIVMALASCFQPQRGSCSFPEATDISFGSWNQREKPHYLPLLSTLGSTEQGKENQSQAQDPEKTAPTLVGSGLPASCTVAARAEKPYNYLYFLNI